MKRWLTSILFALVLVLGAFGFVACGDPGESKENFTGIVFEDDELVYDGDVHTIVATGVPSFATVQYTNAGPFEDAGVYEIGISVSADNYNTYTATATLTIEKAEFTGIVFEDDELVYDGDVHTIVATGVPSFATVQYTNAGPFEDAGVYEIGISVSADNYNTYTATATLTIEKAEFTGITFESDKAFYTGGEKKIEITGDLPEGTIVQYVNNKGVQAGEYNASVTLTHPNYNTKTLTATLTIINVANEAKNLLDKIMTRPDVWAFMPEAFKKEERAVEDSAILDFSTGHVEVDAISSAFIGKQMYVLWEGVYSFQTFLEKFDAVYAVGETIAAAYQVFINNNPEDYKSWQGEAAGFKVKIELEGNTSKLLVGNNAFALELFADSDNNINKGRIQLADSAVANYEMTDEMLTFSLSLSISGVANIKTVKFEKTEEEVSGYFYEYTGLESAALKTSAVIKFDDEYAIVMSAKRESDDLIVEGYAEAYSVQTGEYLGGEVEETVKIVGYDTYWVQLCDIAGIDTIKLIRNENSYDPTKNQHDVYVNGSSEVFVPEYNKVAFVKTSRHFDIEMKDVYYVVAVDDGDETKYETVKTQIPMLFVQEENVADFGEEALSNNDEAFTFEPMLPSENIAAVGENYQPLKEVLDAIKEEMSYAELIALLGTKDNFFNE